MPFPCCVACSKPRRYGSGRTIKSCASQPRRLTDRKSTRLNSSHSQISYAVFCLKKKNKSLVADLGWCDLGDLHAVLDHGQALADPPNDHHVALDHEHRPLEVPAHLSRECGSLR